MKILGFKWGTERRGQFADGHECEDVVNYRQNTFIPKWFELEPRMQSWHDDLNKIPPDLQEGEQEVAPHFHNETIYRAHD